MSEKISLDSSEKGNLIYNIKFGGQSRYIDASVVLIDKIIQTIKIK